MDIQKSAQAAGESIQDLKAMIHHRRFNHFREMHDLRKEWLHRVAEGKTSKEARQHLAANRSFNSQKMRARIRLEADIALMEDEINKIMRENTWIIFVGREESPPVYVGGEES